MNKHTQIYISYGIGKFDINKFQEVKNKRYYNKPSGGLWASPIDAEYGWKDWCNAEQFRNCQEENSFKFHLKNNSNVLYLNSTKDIKRMPLVEDPIITSITCPNFELMKKQGIDAIQFNLSNDVSEDYNNNMYFTLYGWDCDSILIMNKNIIEIIDKNIIDII